MLTEDIYVCYGNFFCFICLFFLLTYCYHNSLLFLVSFFPISFFFISWSATILPFVVLVQHRFASPPPVASGFRHSLAPVYPLILHIFGCLLEVIILISINRRFNQQHRSFRHTSVNWRREWINLGRNSAHRTTPQPVPKLFFIRSLFPHGFPNTFNFRMQFMSGI